MLGKCTLVAIGHFACTALLLKILATILPCCMTCLYTCAANFLMFLVVARLTLPITKKKHLTDKIQPENRAVLITGCDSGFGHELAKHLDLQGFHVFASCLDPKGPGASHLVKSSSKRLQILPLDVTSDDSVQKALQFVKENLGPSEFWSLVNNAGVLTGLSVELASMSEFQVSMEVNCFGPIRVTKAFLPLLRQSRGRVVNVTSFYARNPGPHTAPYAVSKRALAGFNDCLRQEMDAWGIKVISIEPELYGTQLLNSDKMHQNFESTLQALDESVKADYGEKYLKDLNIYAEYHARLASPKFSDVVLAIEDAISLEQPDLVYKPSRNCSVKLAMYAYELLPHVLKDFAKNVVFCVTNFPKPQEAL